MILSIYLFVLLAFEVAFGGSCQWLNSFRDPQAAEACNYVSQAQFEESWSMECESTTATEMLFHLYEYSLTCVSSNSYTQPIPSGFDCSDDSNSCNLIQFKVSTYGSHTECGGVSSIGGMGSDHDINYILTDAPMNDENECISSGNQHIRYLYNDIDGLSIPIWYNDTNCTTTPDEIITYPQDGCTSGTVNGRGSTRYTFLALDDGTNSPTEEPTNQPTDPPQLPS